MKGIFQTFYKKPKAHRKITELVDGVLIGLYDEETFAHDMGTALKKAYAKYGETRHVLVLDVSATGPEDWMSDILPGVVATDHVHLGPYYMVPSLSSVFEVCADAYDYLNSGFKAGSQHLVLIIARNQICEEYRPLTAIALVASAYMTHVAIIENAVVSLEHFKKTVKDACMCSERQLKQDTLIPNLYQYLRYFTMVRINKRFPNNRPLQLAKIIVQGNVTIDDHPWNPILRIYQAGEDAPQCKTIMQKDNGLGGDVMIGTGYASFVLNDVIHGDVIISFEHWNPLSDVTKPLFAIARHTGFLEPPCHRVLYNEIESAPGLASKVALDPETFGVDLYFENVDTPAGLDPNDFSEDAMYEYAKMLDLETAELIGKVADLSEIAEEIATHAPNGPPSCMQAISAPQHGSSARGADFTKEILQKNAERERRKTEQLEAVEDAEVKRKAKLLERIIGTAGVDEFVEVFTQYNEEIAHEEQGDSDARRDAAREVLGRTYIQRKSSPHGTLASSEDDAFGDIARYIDEEELDDIDEWRNKMAGVKRESLSSDEESTEEGEDDAMDERRDAEVLHEAVQVLLRGVKKTGRTDRFRADEVLKNAADSINESELIEQISGALQALVEESRNAAEGGNSRKFFSTQEVLDKVKVMRHEADPTKTSRTASLPPPFPGTAVDVKGSAPPPPPPPPALGGGLKPLTAASPPPPPPPPPPPRSGVPVGGEKTAPPPPPPPPALGGGLKPPPPPPPPPPPRASVPVGRGKAAPPPPPAPPSRPAGAKAGGAATAPRPPPPPPPPPGRVGGGPPPPPPLGGLRKPKPPAPPKLPGGTTPGGTPGAKSATASIPVLPQPAKRNDTKRLNWNPISNIKLAKTLYAQEEFLEKAALDEDTEKDLLETFSNRPPPKMFQKEEQEKANAPETKGPKTAGILEQKRMTNTLIMLRKFECSPEEIAEAVRNLDPLAETLTLDNVNALFTYSFKDEELEMAKNFAAPEEEVAKLNAAEALAYRVARVPRWNVKIRAMVTMRTAKEAESEIRNSLTTLISASKEVLASKRFRQILATILAVGNFLNAGTAKGSARGFRLETLSKLSETKARERGINLLHYITALAERKTPDVLLFSEDMPSIAKAKRISKEDLAKEISTYQRAVTILGREVTMMVKEEEGRGHKKVSLPRTPPPSKPARRLSNLSNGMPSSDPPDEQRDPKSVRNRVSTTRTEENEQSSSNGPVNPLKVAKDIYAKAEDAVGELEKLKEEMLRVFNELVVQLGEEPKHAKTDELFSTLWVFIESFNQSVKENKARRDEKERKERLAKRHAEDQEKRRRRASQKAEAEKKALNKTTDESSPSDSPVNVSNSEVTISFAKDQKHIGDEIKGMATLPSS